MYIRVHMYVHTSTYVCTYEYICMYIHIGIKYLRKSEKKNQEKASNDDIFKICQMNKALCMTIRYERVNENHDRR